MLVKNKHLEKYFWTHLSLKAKLHTPRYKITISIYISILHTFVFTKGYLMTLSKHLYPEQTFEIKAERNINHIITKYKQSTSKNSNITIMYPLVIVHKFLVITICSSLTINIYTLVRILGRYTSYH